MTWSNPEQIGNLTMKTLENIKFIRGYNGGFTVQSSTNGDAAHAQVGLKYVVIIFNQQIMDFGSV